jgi:hypothetical protein
MYVFVFQAQDCSVYAWGINTMGQCGLGHAHSPIVTPQKITLLDGVPIHQVSISSTFYEQLFGMLVPKAQRLFAHLGSSRVEAVRKTLMKLTPDFGRNITFNGLDHASVRQVILCTKLHEFYFVEMQL